MFNDILVRAKVAYPNYQIKFKNQDTFMKILGTLMFFNKTFMTSFTTTIGNTSYFPSQTYIDANPISSSVVLLHELVHVKDSNDQNKFLFGLGYALPQLLFLLVIPLCLMFGWYGLFGLLFLLPIPAYFRMQDEKKAYTISMYVVNKLNIKYGYSLDLDPSFYASEFKTSNYYWVWPFQSIDIYFNTLATQITAGEKPYYEIELYNITDQILGF
jgi:hypothetical protein